MQSRQKDLGRYSAIAPRHQQAAEQGGNPGQKRQQRQADEQRDQARRHQHLHGIEPHHAQGVDLLAHFHRAQLRRDRRACASRHHDRGQKHRQFAQHKNADEIDGERRRAKAAELEHALLGDDAAHKEINQRDNGQRPKCKILDMIRDRGRPQARGMAQRPQQRGDDFAQKTDPRHKVAPRRNQRLADVGQPVHKWRAGTRRAGLKTAVMGLIEQDRLTLRRPAHFHHCPRLSQPGARPVDQPGSRRVQPRHARKINEESAAMGRSFGAYKLKIASRRLHGAATLQCPQAGEQKARSIRRRLARYARLVLLGRSRGRLLWLRGCHLVLRWRRAPVEARTSQLRLKHSGCEFVVQSSTSLWRLRT